MSVKKDVYSRGLKHFLVKIKEFLRLQNDLIYPMVMPSLKAILICLKERIYKKALLSKNILITINDYGDTTKKISNLN